MATPWSIDSPHHRPCDLAVAPLGNPGSDPGSGVDVTGFMTGDPPMATSAQPTSLRFRDGALTSGFGPPVATPQKPWPVPWSARGPPMRQRHGRPVSVDQWPYQYRLLARGVPQLPNLSTRPKAVPTGPGRSE